MKYIITYYNLADWKMHGIPHLSQEYDCNGEFETAFPARNVGLRLCKHVLTCSNLYLYEVLRR